MPAPIAHKALNKPIQTYRATLAELERAEARTEGHYRRAFGHLLVEAASATKSGWTLLDEDTIKVGRGGIRWDGVLKDTMGLRRGFWEAKDSDDKLDVEIARKRDRGYTLINSIFEDTRSSTDGDEHV